MRRFTLKENGIYLTPDECSAFVRGTPFETKPEPCPWCGTEVDRASFTMRDQREPEPGDMTVCLHCGSASLWIEGMRLVKVTNEMRARLLPEDRARLERAQKTIATFLATQAGKNGGTT